MTTSMDEFTKRLCDMSRAQSRKLAEDLGFPITPAIMTDQELDEHIEQNRKARNDKAT